MSVNEGKKFSLVSSCVSYPRKRMVYNFVSHVIEWCLQDYSMRITDVTFIDN